MLENKVHPRPIKQEGQERTGQKEGQERTGQKEGQERIGEKERARKPSLKLGHL